ncbi:MAG: hypothetical protein V4732_13825 [Pseudomonadota bacterium]
MPVGPSIVILKELVEDFTVREILYATSSSKIDKNRLVGHSIRSLRSWGKHLFYC